MPFFSFKEILELMDRVAQSGLGLLEIESAGMRLRIEGKKGESPSEPVRGEVPVASAFRAVAPPASPQPAEALPQGEEEAEDSWHLITSPIVGTFYRTPNPESDPFVAIGDHVNKGKVLCIIEAMKLMNEIEADADGMVVKVYPQNGQPVEYGEKLFALKPV
jgi:acetyl-CoA carboxylase biotin carboxyl carrier protein